MRTSIKWLWRLFIFAILAIVLLFILADFGALGEMPKIKDLENPKSSLSSEVYSSEGALIGKYYLQNRQPCQYAEISPNVINALVSTEDERFYSHSGIDAEAIGRAVKGVLTLHPSGGASTITQQLAKQLTGQGSKNIFQRFTEKIKEQLVAVKLERNLTKEEILTLYLNYVPFSDNAFGIKAASKTYFNKEPKDLEIEEAAVLVGMLKGNSIYNPRTHPEQSKFRRNIVIQKMVDNHKITLQEGEERKLKPLVLDFQRQEDFEEGIAPYFRQTVEQDVKEWCKKKGLNIYKDGLKIYTTLDTTMQQYAEDAVMDQTRRLNAGRGIGRWWKRDKHVEVLMKSLPYYQELKDSGLTHEQIVAIYKKPLKMKLFAWNNKLEKDTTISPWDSIKVMRAIVQGNFMAMDPVTGEVKAWVGGINHKYFKYDHCNYNTKRQVGSTMKPLLYCLAVENGYSPCFPVSCAPVYFPGNRLYNAGGSSYGTLPMKNALAYSINNGTLFVLKQVGIPAFVDFSKKCGIVSTLQPYPALALGASDISLIEMLRAYTMFPNYGINTKPVYISRIEDRNGNVLETFLPERKEVIGEQTAYKMIRMMQGTTSFGTAKALKPKYGITGEVAGKTGTTNDAADCWYIGYTPQLLGGCWVGCDDRFLGTGLGEGATAAMPIWGHFFRRVQANDKLGYNKIKEFDVPLSMQGIDICDTYDATTSIRSHNTRNVSRGYKEETPKDDGKEIKENDWGDMGAKDNGNDDGDYK